MALGRRPEVEHEGLLEPEGGAQLCRQARVQAATGQPDLVAHNPRLPDVLEQPGDPEPADAQPVGDVDLGDALEAMRLLLPRR